MKSNLYIVEHNRWFKGEAAPLKFCFIDNVKSAFASMYFSKVCYARRLNEETKVQRGRRTSYFI